MLPRVLEGQLQEPDHGYRVRGGAATQDLQRANRQRPVRLDIGRGRPHQRRSEEGTTRQNAGKNFFCSRFLSSLLSLDLLSRSFSLSCICHYQRRTEEETWR